MSDHTHDVAAHERWMRLALEEAAEAAKKNEIPVGAVIVSQGRVIACGHNEREGLADPTAHAEILAIQRASRQLGRRRLSGCTLYVTLEPCPMCAGAIAMAQLSSVVFGAYDEKSGCCGSVYRLTEDPALALKAVPAYGGVLAEACASVLAESFLRRRKEGCE